MGGPMKRLGRVLKLEVLKLEDSKLEPAERLVKITAIAVKAAVVTMQLLQARDGPSTEPATVAFAPHEIAVLDKLDAEFHGTTALQKNPHRKKNLKWASWIIARLGRSAR